jgi:hypothetical protein
MQYAPFIATKFVTVDAECDRPKPRRSIFGIISQALHHSRRLQAEKFIRAHRHLLADGWNGSAQSTTGGDDNVDR